MGRKKKRHPAQYVRFTARWIDALKATKNGRCFTTMAKSRCGSRPAAPRRFLGADNWLADPHQAYRSRETGALSRVVSLHGLRPAHHLAAGRRARPPGPQDSDSRRVAPIIRGVSFDKDIVTMPAPAVNVWTPAPIHESPKG